MSNGLKFTRTKDPDEFAAYVAERDGVLYQIIRSTDGFGLVAKRGEQSLIPHKGWGIHWMGTKSACVSYANEFAAGYRSAT